MFGVPNLLIQRLTRSSIFLVLVGSVVLWVTTQTHFSSDLTLFLPPGANAQQKLMVDRIRTGAGARLLLIALQGAPAEILAQTSKALSQALHEVESIRFINNGETRWSQIDREWLFRHRYLLSNRINSQHFEPDSLNSALQARLQELASPFGGLSKRTLPQDPTGEYQYIVQQWFDNGGPQRHLGVWFSADHKQALLMVQTYAAGFDLDGQAKALQAIDHAFAKIPTQQNVQLVRSGSGVFSTEARNTIRRDIQFLSLGAILLVGLLLLWAYHSPYLLLLCAVPLALGIFFAIAVVDLVFGSLHGITLAFGLTLIGVAVDYPIHFYGHWPLAQSAWDNAQKIGPTLSLGIVTTAMGYAAMLLSGFEGLVQLSLFAIVGLVIAGVTTRYLLPWLLSPWPQPKQHPQHHFSPKYPGTYYRITPFFPPAGLLLAIALLATTTTPMWENDLAKLSPLPTSLTRLDERLRDQLNAPELRWLIALWGDSQEQVLQTSEALTAPLRRLQKKGAIGGFELPTRYLPSLQAQQTRQASLPNQAQQTAALQTALQGTPFRKDLFTPFIQAVQATKIQAPLDFNGLGPGMIQARVAAQLFSWQDHWVALVQLRQVKDTKALQRQITSLANHNIQLMDLRSESNNMIRQYRNEALKLLLCGMLVILAVLRWRLTSGAQVLRIFLPLLIAISLAIAILVWAGEALSLFHLFALLLVFGLGLDYGLFLNRPVANLAQWRVTAHSVAVCGFSTTIVFGLLALSEVPVLRAIGFTVCLGASAALVLTWAMAKPEIENIM